VETAVDGGVVAVPPISTSPHIALEAPVPNPAVDGTTISFTTPYAIQVGLRIYDVAGRLVRVLLDKRLDAGRHSIRWDGSTREGRQAPSGVYFCQLSTAEGRMMRRVVILK